jgi:hydrogenase nickel incorporation protein HypA/HybF
MHELSVTKALLALAEQECSRQHITNPQKIVVELGSLKNYKKDPILFYYELLQKEAPIFKHTALEIIEVQAKIKCRECKKMSEVTQPYLLFCSHCESSDIIILEGKDFILKEIIT